MNRETGATAIVPGSHTPEMVAAIGASRASRWQGEGDERKWVGSGLPEEDLESFTDHGLQPAIVNGTAGDLILFDTARECSKGLPQPSHHAVSDADRTRCCQQSFTRAALPRTRAAPAPAPTDPTTFCAPSA